MIVRWLGCFAGKEYTLSQQLRYELSEVSPHKALCAERLQKEYEFAPQVPERAKIGLLVKNKAVVRRFRSDVYSVRNTSGNLYRTREESLHSTHTEVWVLPAYCGIIVRKSWKQLSHDDRRVIKEAALKYSLPIYVLCNGKQLCKID